MLQGLATSTIATKDNIEYIRLKNMIESMTGWKLDSWGVGKGGEAKVDAIIVFRPSKAAVVIGII